MRIGSIQMKFMGDFPQSFGVRVDHIIVIIIDITIAPIRVPCPTPYGAAE